MDKGKRPMDPLQQRLEKKMKKNAPTSQDRLWLQPRFDVSPFSHPQTFNHSTVHQMTPSPITSLSHMSRTPFTSSLTHPQTSFPQSNVQRTPTVHQITPSPIASLSHMSRTPFTSSLTHHQTSFPQSNVQRTPSTMTPFTPNSLPFSATPSPGSVSQQFDAQIPTAPSVQSYIRPQVSESSPHSLSRRQIAQRNRRDRERAFNQNNQQNVVDNQAAPNHDATQHGRRERLGQTPSINASATTEMHQSSSPVLQPIRLFTKQSLCLSSSNVLSPSNIEPSPRIHSSPQPSTQNMGNPSTNDREESSDSDEDVPITYVPSTIFQLRPPVTQNINYAMQAQGRHFLGKMDVECPFCKALHWMDERLSNSSLKSPKFGTCCLQGKIHLPPLSVLPPPFQTLYDGNDRNSKSFRRFMREYNASFAFTSLGVKMDHRVLGGRGPKTFTIQGELCHRTGSLLPGEGQNASYSQLYIYDPIAALSVRQQRNPKLNHDVLRTIQDVMLQYNRFSKDFQHAHEILTSASAENEDSFNIPAYLHYSSKKDKRRYNLPSADEVAVILPSDGIQQSSTRDIVLHLRANNALMQISECHPAYLPLHYVLMFPHGELGWTPELRRWNFRSGTTTDERLTQLDFYSYLLFERRTEYSPILRGKRLFQEFLVDGWAATEQNKLSFVINEQPRFRAELYQKVVDITAECITPDQVGKRIILPASHIGSPRHMFEILQDSLAITRFNKHPDIFLTMTANPNWPEIVDALLPYQNPTDRPDLVARVFELKRRALMSYIKETRLFGHVVGHVYTIEFQKRGLPHMHVLFYMQHSDKISTIAQVDRIVCAEFPDPDEEPELFQTIITCMVHGPCGIRNKNAPCMENDICTKGFPRKFNPTTTIGKDGYPLYRREDNGKTYTVRGKPLDNRDVVPYNPMLSKMFNCHINVEVCAGFRCVKYIHKYIFKGGDMATMVLNGINEVQQYLDARYIGPPEAAWHLFGYRMHDESPNVVRLALHEPGKHRVVFNPNESMESILERAENQHSTLTAFFDCCASDANARQYTYQEFPQHYVWNKQRGEWTRRKRGFAIGRLYFASPKEGERFYLRLLLTVVKGPRSFDDLKTVGTQTYNTFREACIAHGLLEDDDEWKQCLQEAADMKTGYQLRRLFCVILSECSPLYPDQLWEQFYERICDDLPHRIRTLFHIANPSNDQIKDYGLYLLNEMLFDYGKTLADFPPMPYPTSNWSAVSGNRLIYEHHRLQFEEWTETSCANVVKMNVEQREAYNAVIDSVTQKKGRIFFLNGPAGTGKTFVYNTIAATCRRRGDIVVMVASSGIASLLLDGGRTAHSTFKIPLDIMENSVCGFSKQSEHAALFRETKLIIWDEVPMQHKFSVECVDRTLRDICNNDVPFGGITVVLGGDFRQCLPVIPKGVREQIVGATLIKSYLWTNVHVLGLVKNMRLDGGDPENIDFANTLTEIGTKADEIVQLPSIITYCNNLEELFTHTYPGLNQASTVTSEYLTERTILSPRNDEVTAINAAALDIFPGETITYLGADKMEDVDANDPTNMHQYPNEYLNSLDPSGLPPFSLKLKVGSPIMLLRNKIGRCVTRF